MKLIALFMLMLILSSCKDGIGYKNTAHEKYKRQIIKAGLDKTELGALWLSSAEQVFTQADSIALPFSQKGFFDERPRAIAWLLHPIRGQILHFRLASQSDKPFTFFVDLFRKEDGKWTSVFATDSIMSFDQVVKGEREAYMLRIQPRLLETGSYQVKIFVGPSLTYPVKGKSTIGSVWGDPRDAGSRSHEGIDIFAKKGAPVVAIDDGVISRVHETNIGGKVVWQRSKKFSASIYYAHLDKQYVAPNKRVRAGDTIGFVGNTGNARSTSPHLHLGIYMGGGAVNPLSFVEPGFSKPLEIQNIQYGLYRTTSNNLKYPKHMIFQVFDHTRSDVIGYDPLYNKVKLSKRYTQKVDNQIDVIHLPKPVILLQKPLAQAAPVYEIKKGRSLEILGYYRDFSLARSNGRTGWIRTSLLK